MSARDCFRSRNTSAPCDVCGRRADTLHVPTRARGRYCLEHCPACNGGEDEKSGVPLGNRGTQKTRSDKRKGVPQ
jgi:hypothetical protein